MSNNMDLLQKKCTPCEGGTQPFGTPEINGFMARLSEPWQTDSQKIWKEFTFPDFRASMKFVNAIADIAEAEGHHPDIYIFYNKVKVELSTYAIGGLSEHDFIMAAKILKVLA